MYKMYVLVRRDLSTSQQAVQAGHAVAELVQHGSTPGWNKTYLGVDNEEMLEKWHAKLTSKGVECAEFREPDIGDQLTAIATVGSGKSFSNLKLL